MKTGLKTVTLILMALSLSLAACGKSYNGKNVDDDDQDQIPDDGGDVDPDLVFSEIAYGFSIVGLKSGTTATVANKQLFKTPSIHTDSLLRFRIKAGMADKNIACKPNPNNAGDNVRYDSNGMCLYGVEDTNAMADYSCVSYYISIEVDGQVINVGRTKYLKPEGTTYTSYQCANAVESQIVDLSGHLYAGHGPVKVLVTSAKSDDYCKRTGYYCGTMMNLYQYQVATGDLEIQVDGSGL